MKAKLKEKLSEIPNDFLLEILDNLCEKNQHLEKEIEFILNPTKIKYAQSYYNRLVKTAIDTNSWSHFPNKGIIGLRTCVSKMQLLQSVGFLIQILKYDDILVNRKLTLYRLNFLGLSFLGLF